MDERKARTDGFPRYGMRLPGADRGGDVKALKVWGGITVNLGKQCRTIVAAPSKAAALRAIKEQADASMSAHHFSEYWCDTGNALELATALAKPGTVFRASDMHDKNFKEVPK